MTGTLNISEEEKHVFEEWYIRSIPRIKSKLYSLLKKNHDTLVTLDYLPKTPQQERFQHGSVLNKLSTFKFYIITTYQPIFSSHRSVNIEGFSHEMMYRVLTFDGLDKENVS